MPRVNQSTATACRPRACNGFTVIELMVVIATLGILMALALPGLGRYTARARISEGLIWADRCKTGVEEALVAAGSFDVTARLTSICPARDAFPSENLRGTEVTANGVIMIAVNEAVIDGVTAHSNEFWLRPFINGVAVNGTTDGGKAITEWKCGPAPAIGKPLAADLLPVNCRSQAQP